MDAAEIRGNFVSLFAQVDDPGILKVMLDKCLEILKAHDPLAAEFPPDFIVELEEAIAKSDDESEAISNEEAFKLFR